MKSESQQGPRKGTTVAHYPVSCGLKDISGLSFSSYRTEFLLPFSLETVTVTKSRISNEYSSACLDLDSQVWFLLFENRPLTSPRRFKLLQGSSWPIWLPYHGCELSSDRIVLYILQLLMHLQSLALLFQRRSMY